MLETVLFLVCPEYFFKSLAALYCSMKIYAKNQQKNIDLLRDISTKKLLLENFFKSLSSFTIDIFVFLTIFK